MLRDGIWSWLIRLGFAVPITILLIGIGVSLRIVVEVKTTPVRDSTIAFRELGLLTIEQHPGQAELSGPFDLWAGQWWRIPLGGLHHSGWISLGVWGLAFFYLGLLIEPRLRFCTYLLFLAGSLFVTTMPRWILGEIVPAWFIGYSTCTGLLGVVFAQFGLLLFLKRTDRNLAKQFGDDVLLLGLACGLGCLALSTIGLIHHVDNLALLFGFLYGLIWGKVLTTSKPLLRFLLAGWLAVHGLLWPMFSRLIHPIQNARYQWWLAETTTDPLAKRQAYQKALQSDPGLQSPWIALTEEALTRGQPQQAWEILLKAIQEHPHLPQAEKLGPRIWSMFSSLEQREQAWNQTETLSPGVRDAWRQRLITSKQLAEFYLEQEQPLLAWTALMEHLKPLDPPHSKSEAPPESRVLANTIWQRFSLPDQKREALHILEDQLGLNRRNWHLVLIPPRDLIPYYQDAGELFWAWRAVMEELNRDPNFAQVGKQTAREIWKSFPTELRRERARNIVQDVLGAKSLAWQADLGILSAADQHRYRLDQSVELPEDIPEEPPRKPLPPVNPNDPQSAAAGVDL